MTDGQTGAAKAAIVWAATGVSMWLESIGISSWGDLAAMFAALYSFILICEWAWSKFCGKAFVARRRAVQTAAATDNAPLDRR